MKIIHTRSGLIIIIILKHHAFDDELRYPMELLESVIENNGLNKSHSLLYVLQ